MLIRFRGATISRLRVETGADIQVGKDDDLISITGGMYLENSVRIELTSTDEASVIQAKDAILSIVNRSGGSRY
jgi:hypothetical protein